LCHLFIFTFDYFQVQVGFDRFTTVFGSVQVFLLNHFSVGKYVVRINFCSFDENYLVLWLLLRTQISLNKTCLLCVCEFVNDHCFSIFFATPFTNTPYLSFHVVLDWQSNPSRTFEPWYGSTKQFRESECKRFSFFNSCGELSSP